MEIEFKLSCTRQTAARLERQLTRLTGAPPTGLTLQNTYYDTPQQELRKHGIALRIRQQGETRLQTIKCAGQVNGGLSSRPEWETPYQDAFDFSPVDDPSVRRRLETLAQPPGYQAMLDTDFKRLVWHWRPEADTHVEIVLDRGLIMAGGKDERICEVELELLSGNTERLFDLVAELGANAALFPAPLSKATRGSLLLAEQRPPLPAHTSHAAHTSAAFTTLAQACLDHISLNLPANCPNFDGNNLHQVRVGLRKLRALMQLFRPLLRRNWCRRHIVQGAREHMQALALSRNLDVLLHTLVKPAASNLANLNGQRLQNRLQGLRELNFAEARNHLLSQDFAHWLLHTSLALHAQPVHRKAQQLPWAKTAKRLLAPQLAAYTRKLRNPSTPLSLHELRKAGKNLRYQLACSPLINTQRGKHVARQLARLQEQLGQLNDLYSASEVLNQQTPALFATIASLGEYHRPRYQTLQAAVPVQQRRLQEALAALPTKPKKRKRK